MAYFEKRKEWLLLELTQTETKLAELSARGGVDDELQLAELEVARGAYLTRLYLIQEFTAGEVGDRLGSRLGLMARWEHDLIGPDITLHGTDALGGEILCGPEDEWRVGYWMGSFDGDTMRGYLRGYLDLPFVAE